MRVGEGLPDVLAERIARVLLDRRLHVLAEFIVGALPCGRLRARRSCAGELAERKRVERREELLVRQVSGGPEDDERAGFRRARETEALEEGILQLLLGREGHACFSRWPPKAWRMADRSRLANSASPRESKRSYSAADRTGGRHGLVDRGDGASSGLRRSRRRGPQKPSRVGAVDERGGGQVEEPRGDNASAPPDFRDGGQVEVVAGSGRDRGAERFRRRRPLGLADVRVLEDVQPFGVGLP